MALSLIPQYLLPARRESLKGNVIPSSRIGLVAPSLDILGGQGVQAEILYNALRSDGYDVRFVPINPSFPRGLSRLRRIRYLRTVMNQLLYLPRLLVLCRVDIVHVFAAAYWSFLLAAVPAMLMGRLFGKRVILHYHSGEAKDHLAHWGPLVHPWLRLAHKIIVPSEYLHDVFSRFGYRSSVIRNVVDVSRFRYRERERLRPNLLSMRNLEPHYRVDVIIETFVLLKTRYPNARLTIAGYGSQEEMLRRQVRELGIDGVRFIGRVEPSMIPDVLDAADILINASVIDNQPVSILEAFAAGLPVVSTGTGDIASMLCFGTTGYIVPCDEPRRMVDALSSLVEHPDHARLLTRQARMEVERYTWGRIRNDWAVAYGRCGRVPT